MSTLSTPPPTRSLSLLTRTDRLLLADPKSRKVILVEHPLIPVVVKDAIVRVLFLNLHVRNINFPNFLRTNAFQDRSLLYRSPQTISSHS